MASVTPDRTKRWPDVDTDLNAASCMGLGLQYPQLWEVVRRYILRGDNYFQHGGLTTLAANIAEMPLPEATTTLEQYYDQWTYMPPAAGQRGGVNLSGLRAVHAVATVPDYTGKSPVEKRKARMLTLLERHRAKVQVAFAPRDPGKGDPFAGDRAAVDETIEAIKADRQWSLPAESRPSARTEIPVEDKGKGFEAVEVRTETAVAQAVQAARGQMSSVSASDLITFKHGLDQLQQRVELQEALNAEKFAGLDRSIDRFLGKRQVDQGSGQLRSGWIAVGISLLALAATVAVALGWIKTV